MSNKENSSVPAPAKYEQFKRTYPEVAVAYESLGEKCHSSGPLDAKTRALVKLGIAMGAGFEGATHAHTRAARSAGASPEEIRHVALLAVTTLGFPASMRSMSWVNDVLEAP